jgi:hypothetical protein
MMTTSSFMAAFRTLAVRLASLPSATVSLASVNAAAGNAATLVYDQATGKLGVRWGTGTITDATVGVSAATWYVVELRVGFGTNPRVLDWRVDGIVQPQISSAEAASTGTTLRLGTGSASTYTANFDDVVVSQKAGDYPIGDGGVLALRPDGMGTSNTGGKLVNDDGTAIGATTWNRLDDNPMTSITDYVKQTASATANYVELTFQDTTQSCINGVSAAFAYHSSAAGTNAGETRVLDGATTTTVYSGNLGSASIAYKQAMVTGAASPWTQTAVNGLKARIGFSGDVSPLPYWDALLLEYDVPA